MSVDNVRNGGHEESRKAVMNTEEIRALLPHRYPMLLVDRVLELEPGRRVVGLKNVTINEPFFDGHFPGQAIMPGVLIIESMAQVACLMMLSKPEYIGKLAYVGSIRKAKFRRPVLPGDTLIIEALAVQIRGAMGRVKMTARVEGEVHAECEITFAMTDRRDSEAAQQKSRSAMETRGDAENSSAGGHNIARTIHQSENDARIAVPDSRESRGDSGRE